MVIFHYGDFFTDILLIKEVYEQHFINIPPQYRNVSFFVLFLMIAVLTMERI